MIEMTITAQDANDLKAQVAALARTLGLFTGTPAPETIPVIPAQEVTTKTKTPAKKPVPIKPAPINGAQSPGAPEPQPVAVVDGLGTETVAQLPNDPVIEEPQEQIVVTPPKEMLELKQKVIDALQAAFRAGKVQKVRDVLANYGGGAKSFREIDAVAFPVIDKAIQSGALN